MNIIKIENDDPRLSKVISLAWNTFLEYEAPDYSEEGVMEFKKSIDDPEFISKLRFTIALEDDNIVGVIAVRNMTHIAMFFVDGKYHRRGIGKSLYKSVVEDNKEDYFTVNSSPYAKEVYEHLGFELASDMEEVNGLKFYPMRNNEVHNKLEKSYRK